VLLYLHIRDGIPRYALLGHLNRSANVEAWEVTYSSLTGEKMEPTPERSGLNEATMKETVLDERQIMQWIAAKPLPDQEQSVNLL
jgi:hypothetical protein